MTRSEFLARWPMSTDDALKRNGFEPLNAGPIVTSRVQVAQSTDEAKLNKTERAYLAYLRALGSPWIGIQCLTLKLADDTRYTPDFITINTAGRIIAHETKGFFRDDAKVKLKVAARSFPWIEFILIHRDGPGWQQQQVKP